MARTSPPPGIYVPTLCFFKGENQEIDHETITKHVQRLARGGVQGLVANGTTGEPSHLSRAERLAVIKTHRAALDSAGFQNLPLIVGTGVSSTWETIELTKEAAQAGANYAMVIPPGYFKGAMTDAALEAYFTEVADASPIPILLYNFPGVGAANGIDLELNLIAKLAKHPKIVGIKLSCGNMGKAARLAALYSQDEFAVFMGLVEMLLHGLTGSGISGVITGLANDVPKACVRVFDLYQKGELEEARKAQKEVSLAGELELKGGIHAMRYGCVHYFGYGGESRRPIQPISEDLKAKTVAWLDPVVAREK
ncbi:L-threo-3-deoxy-hexylosonate aldolase [Ceratobasidium theobromae]|uniref:L-threo-3-deoxy-hexylosonate aldolase n=1 Tax=Ceratobasidium theobromae TaxID=1582974 RepID=A0A5N5QGG8_9AGAM|nr:L-threo-3-deoxy-hexylosonate aldolase [Ceratobasidium theobromae]